MQELVSNQILTLISHFKITIPILGFFLLTSLNCGNDTVNTEEEAISVVKSLLNEEVDHWLTLCKQTSCSQEHINKSRSNYEHLNFVLSTAIFKASQGGKWSSSDWQISITYQYSGQERTSIFDLYNDTGTVVQWASGKNMSEMDSNWLPFGFREFR
ncbi:hypothetical protein FIM04_04750 [SAR202 cluster bacterium AC-409-J13_OGT_754m]|nr:hypothetical protein [SAR202 cluster bacterium AC-409-J13_OGT_754m]